MVVYLPNRSSVTAEESTNQEMEWGGEVGVVGVVGNLSKEEEKKEVGTRSGRRQGLVGRYRTPRDIVSDLGE